MEYGGFIWITSVVLADMESDYQRYLQEGYTFNKVYNANAFSLGRFVSDVFQGIGPVIVLKEGASFRTILRCNRTLFDTFHAGEILLEKGMKLLAYKSKYCTLKWIYDSI